MKDYDPHPSSISPFITCNTNCMLATNHIYLALRLAAPIVVSNHGQTTYCDPSLVHDHSSHLGSRLGAPVSAASAWEVGGTNLLVSY